MMCEIKMYVHCARLFQQPHSGGAEIEVPMQGVEREGRRYGEMCRSHHPTRGLGGASYKLPSGVRSEASAENGFYAYLRSERSTFFKYFLRDGGAP